MFILAKVQPLHRRHITLNGRTSAGLGHLDASYLDLQLQISPQAHLYRSETKTTFTIDLCKPLKKLKGLEYRATGSYSDSGESFAMELQAQVFAFVHAPLL